MPQLLTRDTNRAGDDIAQIHIVEPVVESEVIPVDRSCNGFPTRDSSLQNRRQRRGSTRLVI